MPSDPAQFLKADDQGILAPNRVLSTPVAFFIFRRPECTRLVFDAIRAAQPQKLIVVADGWRNEAEREVCLATREITEQIDWDCSVERYYSDVNLGCGRRMSSGLSVVFDRHDRAIILEDDCLPTPGFFGFCDELLERYSTNKRVSAISGMSVYPFQNTEGRTYAFSRYSWIWGWATWKRSWQSYDYEIRAWQSLRNTGWLRDLLKDRSACKHWENIFDRMLAGEIDTWDYQWVFNCLQQDGLSVVPSLNMVSNIGFGPAATHTKDSVSRASNRQSQDYSGPLLHPSHIEWSSRADALALRSASHFGFDTPSFGDLMQYYSQQLQNAVKAPLRRVLRPIRRALTSN
jgi:hypothetical protein